MIDCGYTGFADEYGCDCIAIPLHSELTTQRKNLALLHMTQTKGQEGIVCQWDPSTVIIRSLELEVDGLVFFGLNAEAPGECPGIRSSRHANYNLQ